MNLNFFLVLWVFFALLDPDPDSQSGSRASKSESNPDPQHCLTEKLLRNIEFTGIHGEN
jgi:hypothetical protein